MSEVVHGGCLCGAVRFELRGATRFCVHCHCSMCRRAHGAGFVTWVGVPRAGFALTQGEPQLRRFASSDHGTRSFCSACGSSLLCESSRHPDLVDVVLAACDTPPERAPESHLYWDDRAPWIELGDGLPRLGGPSGVEPTRPAEPVRPLRAAGGDGSAHARRGREGGSP